MAVNIPSLITPILVFVFGTIVLFLCFRSCNSRKTMQLSNNMTSLILPSFSEMRARTRVRTRTPQQNIATRSGATNTQFQTAMPHSLPNLYQPLNSMPVPQCDDPMPIIPNSHSPTPFTPNIVPPNSQVNPRPVPQAFSPASRLLDSSYPNPSTSSLSLIDRMQQVQTLMVDIHQLESKSGERNSQRVQELRQRVIELSDIDRREPVHNPADTTPNCLPPPPAYSPRSNNSPERPELGDGSG